MTESKYKSLRITRTEPELADQFDGDWLTITQPDWPEPPAGGFFGWMVKNKMPLSLGSVNMYLDIYKSHCNDDGALEVEVQVRRSRTDLNYTLARSYGELSGKISQTAARKKSLTVEGESSIDLQQEISGTFSATWEGPVYGMDGLQIVPPPPIVRDGSVLSFGQEVVGVLRLVYSERYDMYILTIIPREEGEFEADNIEGAYQSTVIAIWGLGQIETMDVSLPDMSGNCNGYGSKVIINPGDDDDDNDDEKCVRHNILVDPCTEEVVRTWDEQIACPEDEE